MQSKPCTPDRGRWRLLASLAIPVLGSCGGGSSDTPAPPPPPATGLSLLAGNTDGPGNQDGPASAARFSLSVRGLAVAPNGDLVIADAGNNAIRKLSTAGQVSTLAGGSDVLPQISVATPAANHANGTGGAAKFKAPQAVAVDAAGNTYVADTDNHVVPKIDPAGNTSTLAGQPGVCGNTDGFSSSATFCLPTSIAVDGSGNVYISESMGVNGITGNPIRKITAAGAVSTVTSKASQRTSRIHFSAGTYIYFYAPVRLAIDTSGTLYAADPNDKVIRKYSPQGLATIVSGTVAEDYGYHYADGPANVAKFGTMDAIALDRKDRLYVLDAGIGGKRIRRIESDGSVSTVVGPTPSCDDSNAPYLCWGQDLANDASGNFLVNESPSITASPIQQYSLIRRFTSDGASSSVVAGSMTGVGSADGTGAAARFYMPSGLAAGKAGKLYVADTGNNVIRVVSPTGVTRTLGASGKPCASSGGKVSELSFCFVQRLAVDAAESLYVPNAARIVKATPSGDVVLVADLAALMYDPQTRSNDNIAGIAVDSVGNVYAAAASGSAIVKIPLVGEPVVFAGALRALGHADGQGNTARFSRLGDMAIDSKDNLYVIDGTGDDNSVGPTVRKITPAGVVSTIAGSATEAPGLVDGSRADARLTVSQPGLGSMQSARLTLDDQGNVYVTDSVHSVVRKIAVADGSVSTLAGQRTRYGFTPGDLPGMVNRPVGVATQGSTLYVTTSNAVAAIKLP